MMQGLHHHQQQLAALLSAALPKDNDPSAGTPPSVSGSAQSAASEPDDSSSRVAAVTSLHRAILYPPNTILVTHSASFLAQGLVQLLTDKSYLVRQSAATAYGALSSALCSMPRGTNGRQNVLSGYGDRFMGWALPLVSNGGNGTAELALEGLREFLSVGDVGAVERYALPVLKACQELLEDERTSLNLLQRLLAVLTLISVNYSRSFHPHFVDIVDLLLGWAMVPDLAETDRRVIMDSFLQFQKNWANNMQFSLGLLSKFLGDMDALLQDTGPGTQQQFQRLLALLCCFSTVLQAVASGLLEMNMLEQICEPLCQMVKLLLGCLLLIGRKFGWSKWIEDSWKCLTLIAEILGDRFTSFYPIAVDVLFQSLGMGGAAQLNGMRKISSFQVHGVLKTNLQLLSLQKHGLLPPCARKILEFDAPISQLRLHPNHLITGSVAATYIFLLQHVNNKVVEEAMNSLIEELAFLKNTMQNYLNSGCLTDRVSVQNPYSQSELFALIHFDLKVLSTCASASGCHNFVGQADLDSMCLYRSRKLSSFIRLELDPFDSPLKSYVELQVAVLKTLQKLAEVELLSNCSLRKQNAGQPTVGPTLPKLIKENDIKSELPIIIVQHIRSYSGILVSAFQFTSPLAVKLLSFDWLLNWCTSVNYTYENEEVAHYPCEVSGYAESVQGLLFSILDSASDREPEVRSHVASVLVMLLQAKLVHLTHFSYIAEVVLEKLCDPEKEIRDAFGRLFSHVLPITVYVTGLYDCSMMKSWRTRVNPVEDKPNLHWRRVFAIKKLHQQLRSQQFVSILSYISQRWKVPLSSWIQRLIYSCRSSKKPSLAQLEEVGNSDVNGLWWDIKLDDDFLENVCSVNILAGAWWAINEAARFCISTRLRTNLGGPTQTFAALERMLLDVAHVIKLDSDQSDGNLTITSSSYAHLLPMRLLLDFVEALKKNVYNGYEGSIVLPSPSKQSSLFFRANKKVCEEWFSRICEPMMNAGSALQCHDAVIQYSTLRLLELKTSFASALRDKSRTQVSEALANLKGRFQGDVLRVLRQMALALCRNHEREALIGLQNWAAVAFFPLFDDKDEYLDGEVLGKLSWITGLVYQAVGQYEKAAAHFTHLLQTDDSLGSMGSEGVQFSIARIIESYTAVSDWKSLESWLLELQALRSKHAGKNYSGALTAAGNEISFIQSLARFDDGDFQASWACLDLTPKSSSELTLDPKLALQRSEQMLLQAMLFHKEGRMDRVPQELLKAKSMLDETLTVLPIDGLLVAAPHVNQLHCIHALEESCNTVGGQGKHLTSLLGSYIEAVQSPINWTNQDCSLWLKVLRVYQSTQPSSTVTLKLSKNLLNLACKQRNLLLANRLNSYLKSHIENCLDKDLREDIVSTLQYQNIILMYAEGKLDDALFNLWSLIRPSIFSSAFVSDSLDNVLKAKACLKLSKWLPGNASDPRLEEVVLKLREDLNSNLGTGSPSLRGGNVVATSIDELIGTATELSTRLCPTMGKSWISYASWCYANARSSLSFNNNAPLPSYSHSLRPQVLQQSFSLTENELLKVKDTIMQLLLKSSSCEDMSENSEKIDVNTLYAKTIDIIEVTAASPGQEDNTGESLSAMLTSKVQKCLACANVVLDDPMVPSLLGDIVDVWWSLRRRKVYLFGHAAQAFISYLSYSSSEYSDCQLSSPHSGMNYKSKSYSLKATLHVLNILLNYGVELKDTLEPALSTTPLLPWQEITPQLFARLSCHPEILVRKQLESLLVMLAKLSPWSILYPALVDASTQEKETSEELLQILACLNQLYPSLVQDARLIIKELENVTVLWEELWLSTLQDLHADVLRRIHLLREEAKRIAENSTLSHGEKNRINAAKYSAMMAPVVVVLERRLASTSKKPETPHETWFHNEYGDQIKSAVSNFKTPPAPASLGDVWRPFEGIAASLSSSQRKSSASLADVAPKLAQLSSSEAPMPGLEKQMVVSDSEKKLTTSAQGIVTISSFSQQLTILSTKTKPKKIIIVGSDGQKYTYLLKGREDLRLDARIMQLLQSVNGFLHSSSATRNEPLGIRYYSVTPISGRAGLIQWVDNVVSMYSVFKSWQNRVQQAQLSALGTGDAKSAVPPPVPRPIDMFYGKIIPALKEKGIRRVISRRDWPHEVKHKVLLDLMEEAPKQLLHQELWCASEGFKAFSSKQKRFSSSVATMSIVGHMLGLGDRHLDNILVDFCSGDILHIDYNVCFDKGQRLKIPEIVPFRLTQTIEAAIGLTGIEGAFRANCESVLGVLKANKDIILMLLEVFAWDPLVEWTREDFHDDAAIVGEERKGMELAVSLSLFASRMQEIRIPLQEHHDLLLSVLPAVESSLEKFVSILNQYEIVSALFHRVDQERSNLILHETSAKSIVAEASRKSEAIRTSLEMHAREFSQAQSGVMEKAQDATSWIEQHGRMLDALRSSSIPEINAWMRLTDAEESLSLTSAVLLSGVPLTIVPEPTQAQCTEIDREVFQLVDELDRGLSSTVTALQTYSLALQRILPLNYLTTSSVHGWAQVLQLAVNNLTSDVLSLSRRQSAELIAQSNGDRFNSAQTQSRYDELCCKVGEYAAEIEKREEDYTALVGSIGSETEIEAKARLLSSFLNYVQFPEFERKADAFTLGSFNLEFQRDARLQRDIEEKKVVIQRVLSSAVITLYNDIKGAIVKRLGRSTVDNLGNRQEADLGSFIYDFEEQVEKCTLVAGFLCELNQHMSWDNSAGNESGDIRNCFHDDNWALKFQTCMLSCKKFMEHMIEVLPEAIRCLVSFTSELMDVLGSFSQIRGSIDTSLEQLIDVELEKASLVELEKTYIEKVNVITDQQLALEEASAKGRDHLSWEEAEELASQEEACRAQLDKLHQTWNQKDLRSTSLVKRESTIIRALLSSQHHFQSLMDTEQALGSKGKSLLSALVQPFSDLESAGETLASTCSSGNSHLRDLLDSGCPISDLVWRLSTIHSSHAFFIWKVSLVGSFLDSCTHAVASFVDQNLGFDHLVNVVKEKIEVQLQKHVGHYLKERVAPILLARLSFESESLKHVEELEKVIPSDSLKTNPRAVKSVLTMIEEYCSARETVRATRLAASLMKKRIANLKECLFKVCLEMIHFEWMHSAPLNPLQNSRLILHQFLASHDHLLPAILNISRPKLVESMQSSIGRISGTLENLQACEQASVTAEGQLERAMVWACGGPGSNSAARNSGIPPEFHDHLMRRRRSLWEAREKASEIMKICVSVLEFEASRDGIMMTSEELYPLGSGSDGRAWQQAYSNILTTLDITYHSFTRAEQEWKFAQNNLEAASSSLFSARNELSMAAVKVKSVSDDLQSTLLAMRDCAYEASVALSAFVGISKGHSTLTSECGSMLEEVLAITEGLHDVHSSGKEAAALHSSLTDDLSKVNGILLPLESLLSKDVAAMADAMGNESETKIDISPIHGQAIFQSYHVRVKDASQAFKPLMPSLTSSVRGLYSSLTRLARAASLHAGNLHKALEGLGDSHEERSKENSSGSDIVNDDTVYYGDSQMPPHDDENNGDILDLSGLALQEKEWISPPDSISSRSSVVDDGTSNEPSLAGSSHSSDLSESFVRGATNTEGEVSDHSNEIPSSRSSGSRSVQVTSEQEFVLRGETALSTQDKIEEGTYDGSSLFGKEGGTRPSRGKNAYAMSIIRRVEMKLDGRDITDKRDVSIAEQVDFLLKQAINTDNLCNMYEGWTPWI